MLLYVNIGGILEEITAKTHGTEKFKIDIKFSEKHLNHSRRPT